MKKYNFLSVISITFFISACSNISLPIDYTKQNPSIIGYWEDNNGILSDFQQDGTFKTFSTDGSNAILATGFYKNKSLGNIEIKLTSFLRNSSETIQCQLISRDKISCTSKIKGQFYLQRTHLTEHNIDRSRHDLPGLLENPTEPRTSVIFYS
ncbi:MAG: hypothetical protein EU981_03640 [Candidatus Liberibacter ctenarytainae]|uniref:Lipoprotein n=1 Tax=Candidatus Liberibacter ctenarytainae TaxID=2020335 RepID=A0A937AEW7_9HYPH|nr:hypothetical protein [Candidatus Liberibacter ctenarytainae]